MELPTSVTIVEEDGSTSIVEDASVSSILTDAGPNSSIQFTHTQGGKQETVFYLYTKLIAVNCFLEEFGGSVGYFT